MKYKFKIDTPWGKKGDELTVVQGSLGQWFKPNNPQDFPELFEEIIEKTNADKWREILKPFFTKILVARDIFTSIKNRSGHSVYELDYADNQLGIECLLLTRMLSDKFNADAAYNEICGDKK